MAYRANSINKPFKLKINFHIKGFWFDVGVGDFLGTEQSGYVQCRGASDQRGPQQLIRSTPLGA